MAATRNSNYYEIGLVHPSCENFVHGPYFLDGYSDDLDAIDADGCVTVPDTPGLGGDIDWADLAQHHRNRTVYC